MVWLSSRISVSGKQAGLLAATSRRLQCETKTASEEEGQGVVVIWRGNTGGKQTNPVEGESLRGRRGEGRRIREGQRTHLW